MQSIIMSFVLLSTLSWVIVDTKENTPKEKKTIKFKVEGICEMCKETIEAAVSVKGVKFAEWDKQSKILTVVYRTDKITEDELHHRIAASGYDTEKVKATDVQYSKVHTCCRYRELDPH